nr:uncharacterized protein LOC129256709 [Lytechinus pictus]
MTVDKPISRLSRSEGGNRPRAPTKHSKNLGDIRVTSQKQALQHTVRAKKLDERQLFKFLKSLDDSKSRRLLQIDKEVAEIEKLLKRLNSEQEDAIRQREGTGENIEQYEDDNDLLVTKSAGAVRRHKRSQSRYSTKKMSKEFDEYAFRARTKRGSVERLDKDKANKALNSYYRFDSEGNRRIFSPLISSPSKTPKPQGRVAWDTGLFLDDVSLSNYTVATGTDSRVDSATNKSLISSVGDDIGEDSRADTITPGRAIFITSGKGSSQGARKSTKSNTTHQGSKSTDTKGVDHLSSSNSKSQKPGLKTNKVDRHEKLMQFKRQISDKSEVSEDSNMKSDTPHIKLSSHCEEEEDIPLTFKRSKLKLKRRPQPQGLEAKPEEESFDVSMTAEFSEDELQRATTVEACTGKSCQVTDCIFHRPLHLRRQSSTIADDAATIDEYYRIASETRSRATHQPSISPVFRTADDGSWNQTRRLPVSPPSPTPSEILADVVTERKVIEEKPDYTDLEVMLSVRRPTKGSNRDRMLKDKEDNIKNTFKVMRQKMAASVPPDFNTNYGTPTPNWKILNPLKMRHKIVHKSPLFTLWKLN